MQFFSIYDILLNKTKEKNLTTEDMYAFFRKNKISKTIIDSLKQTTYIPDNNVKNTILNYLEISELEMNLMLGYVPPEYRNSFFSKIREVAALLDKDEGISQKEISTYFETPNGKLYHDDCIEVMKNMANDSVDMIFADPPFNLQKTYDPGVGDNLTMSSYLNWTYQWLDECTRILKPNGRIFIYNLPKWCVYIANYLGKQLTFWDWIAIDMKYSLPIQNRLYPAHYALVSYIKGTKATTFHNQRIPMQTCKFCGGELKDYGGYKDKMNPAGVNVSDVWSDIYPVRHKNTKNRKYNELPIKLLDRIISMSTEEGDIIFDPFGGSGTTYVVAELLNRKWIGAELGNCEIIKQRILDPHQDVEQMKKIYAEKDKLFTEETLLLREKNGFWNCQSIREKNNGQISLNDIYGNKNAI